MIEQEACAQKGSYLKRLVENLLTMIEQEACASNHDLCQLLGILRVSILHLYYTDKC